MDFANNKRIQIIFDRNTIDALGKYFVANYLDYS